MFLELKPEFAQQLVLVVNCALDLDAASFGETEKQIVILNVLDGGLHFVSLTSFIVFVLISFGFLVVFFMIMVRQLPAAIVDSVPEFIELILSDTNSQMLYCGFQLQLGDSHVAVYVCSRIEVKY